MAQLRLLVEYVLFQSSRLAAQWRFARAVKSAGGMHPGAKQTLFFLLWRLRCEKASFAIMLQHVAVQILVPAGLLHPLREDAVEQPGTRGGQIQPALAAFYEPAVSGEQLPRFFQIVPAKTLFAKIIRRAALLQKIQFFAQTLPVAAQLPDHELKMIAPV